MSNNIDSISHDEQSRRHIRVMAGKDTLTGEYSILDVDTAGRTSSRQYIWDTISLSWVAGSSAGGAVGGGGDGVAFAEIATTTASYSYSAKAPPGSSAASAVWQVCRTSLTDPYTTTWADGNANFDNVATDLTALSYS